MRTIGTAFARNGVGCKATVFLITALLLQVCSESNKRHHHYNHPHQQKPQARTVPSQWPSKPVSSASISRWLKHLDAKVSCVVPGKTESEIEVQDWLAKIGLLDFWLPIQKLGVASFEDLEFVEPDDLTTMGMKPVQRRKFIASLDKLLLDHGDADRGSSASSPRTENNFGRDNPLSVGSFPYAVPPHLHPKWTETKDLVVDKMMKTPLGELRTFFQSEADSQTETRIHSGRKGRPSQSSHQGSFGGESANNDGAPKSEIADEAASFLASLEEMGEAVGKLGVDVWSLSIQELMTLQQLALEESGLRGPDEETNVQKAMRAFQAGDVMESQRLFELDEKKWSQEHEVGEAFRDVPLLDKIHSLSQKREALLKRKSVENYTSKADDLFQNGLDALENGNLEGAAALFSSVLKIDSNNEQAKHNLMVAEAQLSSLTYIETHAIAHGTSLGGVMDFALEKALKLMQQPQIEETKRQWLFLELGVYKGSSLRRLANTVQRYNQVAHGFDSWYGLPEAFAGVTSRGAFSTNGKLPADLPQNVVLHSGWLNESMPTFVKTYERDGEQLPAAVAFVHVDIDLYSSTIDGLEPLITSGMMVPGTIILFDEYLGWPGWDTDKSGEASAWRDICRNHGIEWRHLLVYKQRMVIEVVRTL